jgi:hypothetical protein
MADSQADSAGLIPVTRSKGKAQVRTTVPILALVGPRRFERPCNWSAIGLIGACEEDGASGNRAWASRLASPNVRLCGEDYDWSR